MRGVVHRHRSADNVYSRSAAVWLLVSTGASLYYAMCLAAPQLTSQDYKYLATGVLQVPPIVMGCISGDDRTSSVKKCLDAARRGALSGALEEERRRGGRGILIWGVMLVVSAILLRVGWVALRRERTVAV